MFKSKRFVVATLFVLCMVVGLTASVLAADYPNLPLNIPKVDAPTLDGKLNDATWLNASIKGGKYVIDVSNDGVKLSEYPRVAYIGYGDEALYVAYLIYAPDTSKLVGNGTSWWNNDEVEIFIDPAKVGKVNQIGITSAGFISKAGVTAVVSKDGVKWVVEAAIPWSVVGASAPKKGDIWGINLTGRQMAAGDQWLAYNCTFGAFANLAKMATAVFGE